MSEMRVNDSERCAMKQRSLVNTGYNDLETAEICCVNGPSDSSIHYVLSICKKLVLDIDIASMDIYYESEYDESSISNGSQMFENSNMTICHANALFQTAASVYQVKVTRTFLKLTFRFYFKLKGSVGTRRTCSTAV